ncbi:purine nucleoside metabolic process, partial [Homalodisca vitripennis]
MMVKHGKCEKENKFKSGSAIQKPRVVNRNKQLKMNFSEHIFHNIKKTNNSKTHTKSQKASRIQSFKTNVTICSDSQGKNLAPKITELCEGRVNAFGYVRPNTTLLQVIDSAKIDEESSPLVVLGGTNDSLKENFNEIYESLESKLKVLTVTRPVFLCTVPNRYDKILNGPENDQIQKVNNYIMEIAARIDGVYIINLNHLGRQHYTVHGLHLNMQGTTKLARIILKALTWWNSQELHFKYERVQPPVKIIEKNMTGIITEHKDCEKTAFAHCISGDFENERQMTAGVAVIFKQQFGRPLASNCITSHLAYQQVPDGAGIYSLITKDKYKNKPTLTDYDKAFEDFSIDFKRRGFTRLICSAMGCVRDKISIEHFVTKIMKFHHLTGASVDIILYNQWSSRVLWNGLTHDEFITDLKYNILSKYPQATPSSFVVDHMQPETSSLQPLSSTITTNLGPQGDKEMALHQDHLDFQSKQHLEAVSGESEGSILGPLLFLCYLRGLPGVIQVDGSVCLYADDTNITIS